MKQSCCFTFCGPLFPFGKERIASLLQLRVLCEADNGTHKMSYKKHEHKAAQKQHHYVMKAGARDPAFCQDCTYMITSKPVNCFMQSFFHLFEKTELYYFEGKCHGHHKWHSAIDLHYHSSLSWELLHLVKNLQLGGIWREKYYLILRTYLKVELHLYSHAHYSLLGTCKQPHTSRA